MRRIKLAAHFAVEELEQHYRQAHDGIERSHWQIIWLLAQGHAAVKVAAMTGYSAYWIGQLAQRYNAAGAAGLRNHRQESRANPHALLGSAEDWEALRTALAHPAPQGDVWNSRTVAAWLGERVGHRVHPTTAWKYLRQLGWTPQTPRPRHTRSADPAEQEAFKKSSLTR
ncbi:MAG TPA: winged helix-turn-helix domain-containing protein [Ktedonobacterales bacterium]